MRILRRTFLFWASCFALPCFGCRDQPARQLNVGDPYTIVDDYYGLTRIHAAARDGDIELLDAFLKNGADPNTPDTSAKGMRGKSTARSPIHWALNKEVVDVLMKHGADIEFPAGGPPEPPIAYLAFRNRHSAVARLIELGVAVDERDEIGSSALIWCLAGLAMRLPEDELHEDKALRLKTACLLIENGADINQSDSGSTALGTAVKFAPEYVPTFLELGADPEILDNGKTPLAWAIEWEDDATVRLIKDAINSKKITF